jgi:hypothetical protein
MKLHEVITPVTPIVPPTTKRPSLARHPGMLRKDDPSPQDLETELKVRGRDPVDINAMLRQIDFAKKKGLTEINADDELTVSQHIEDYFYKRGYQLAGEGRDQIAFVSPRNTVVKVLGIGDPEREKIVRDYVAFFLRNQRNPYYPRIYNTGEFSLNGETYFVYEMEYLNYVANEEVTLEYLEDLMKAALHVVILMPINKTVLYLLSWMRMKFKVCSWPHEDLIDALGGSAPLDLSNIENLRRRGDGHLVIMDPFSL